MVRDRGPYGYTPCAICDEATHSEADPPICRGCHWLMARGSMRPVHVAQAVRDALAALAAYRVSLWVTATPTTPERRGWCLDYCRARGAYLRAHNGRLRPAVPVPHTVPGSWHGSLRVKRPPTHSPGTTRAPGP